MSESMRQRSEQARMDGSVIGLVLAEVRDMGPVTAAAIARECQISESTVRRYLRALEEAELVESDNYQRRARVFIATERG